MQIHVTNVLHLISTLWIFSIVIKKGEGLKCYICQSESDRRCGDNFELLPSDDAAFDCIGSCSKIRATKGLTAIIVRGCTDFSKYGRTSGCQSGEFSGNPATICLCDNRNYCNRGTQIGVKSLAFVVLCSLAVLNILSL